MSQCCLLQPLLMHRTERQLHFRNSVMLSLCVTVLSAFDYLMSAQFTYSIPTTGSHFPSKCVRNFLIRTILNPKGATGPRCNCWCHRTWGLPNRFSCPHHSATAITTSSWICSSPFYLEAFPRAEVPAMQEGSKLFAHTFPCGQSRHLPFPALSSQWESFASVCNKTSLKHSWFFNTAVVPDRNTLYSPASLWKWHVCSVCTQRWEL